MNDVDLVIRGGTVIDGSGTRGMRADIAIDAGRIVAIDRRLDADGRRELDAEGHVVTPGFVDGHTHMDAQVFWDQLGTSSCWHGVTSVVMGNCGFTLAPARSQERALVVRNLERAEDISAEAMALGIEWKWETFAEYLDALDTLDKGINYAANVGHSALRTWAMGERAFEMEASPDEVALMTTELRAAMRAGAIGFTTSRSPAHQTSDDRPVASRLASWDEVRALVEVMGEEGKGTFQFATERAAHERGEPDPAVRKAFYERLGDLAVDTGIPIAIPLPAIPGFEETLDHFTQIAKAGGEVFGLSHSRGIGVVLSFLTQLPYDSIDEWQDLRRLPLESQRMRLTDCVERARLVEAANHALYPSAVGAEARPPDYEVMRIMRSAYRPNPSVAEEARRAGVDPVELIIDLALASNFTQLFVQPILNEDPKDQLAVLRDPRAIMTFSDAGAHVSQIVDCSIQTHLLAHWVREAGAIELHDAVRMITSVPARAWGLLDRGLLAVGMAADVNIFDPEEVAPEVPTVVADLPGGATRLVQRACGFRATVVNGRVTLENGESTGEYSGRLLRGPWAPRGHIPTRMHRQ